MKPIDERLNLGEMEELRKARASNTRLTLAQTKMAAHLQIALRQLPLDVVENHISVALQERPDFDQEASQRFARMMNDRAWDFL